MLYLLRYIYLSTFSEIVSFLGTFIAPYFILLLEYICEEVSLLLLRSVLQYSICYSLPKTMRDISLKDVNFTERKQCSFMVSNV